MESAAQAGERTGQKNRPARSGQTRADPPAHRIFESKKFRPRPSSRKASGQAPVRFIAKQEEMQFEGPPRGRFEKTHETMYSGENLDIPLSVAVGSSFGCNEAHQADGTICAPSLSALAERGRARARSCFFAVSSIAAEIAVSILQRQGHQGGTGAAEKTAQRAGLPRRGQDFRKAGNERLAIRLVQMIDKHARATTRNRRCKKAAAIRAVRWTFSTAWRNGTSFGKKRPRRFGRKLQVGHERDEMKAPVHRHARVAETVRRIVAAA